MKKKLKSEKQSEAVYVRFTPNEMLGLKELAGKRPLATFIREAVLTFYWQGLEDIANEHYHNL